mgnify:CR=1 FL=1
MYLRRKKKKKLEQLQQQMSGTQAIKNLITNEYEAYDEWMNEWNLWIQRDKRTLIEKSR